MNAPPRSGCSCEMGQSYSHISRRLLTLIVVTPSFVMRRICTVLRRMTQMCIILGLPPPSSSSSSRENAVTPLSDGYTCTGRGERDGRAWKLRTPSEEREVNFDHSTNATENDYLKG